MPRTGGRRKGKMVRAAALKAREALSVTIKEELLASGRKPAEPKPYNPDALVKRKRCGQCAACHAPNCGRCDNCRDMPCFGGKGTKRQSCRDRLCVVIAEEDAKIREEREKEREKQREAREEERARLREQKERERIARGFARRRSSGGRISKGSRRTLAGVRELQALIGRAAIARLPAVHLDAANVSGGWGRHTITDGDKVEARGIEKDEAGNDNGAFHAGTIVGRRRPDEGDDDDDDDDDEDEGEEEQRERPAKRGRQEEQLLVEFDELLEPGNEEDEGGGSDGDQADADEDQPRLREWVAASNVRRRPPDAFPTGMLELVRVGDLLELLYDDGWWEVEVKDVQSLADARESRRRAKGGTSSAAAWRASYGEGPRVQKQEADEELERFTVESVRYKDSTHTVGPSRLRPRWMWSTSDNAWRFELINGHGCVPVDPTKPGGKPTFTFAKGAVRSMNTL